jgi:hypothetical protein
VSNYLQTIVENISHRESAKLEPLILEDSINEMFSEKKLGYEVRLNIESGGKIAGISKNSISKFNAKINLNNFKLEGECDVEIPELRYTGIYDMDGRVFRIIPICGKGLISMELKSIKGKIWVNGHFCDNKMKTELINMRMTSFSSVSLHFENLIDSSLSPYLNGLINFMAKPLLDIVIVKNQPNSSKIKKVFMEAMDEEINKLNIKRILNIERILAEIHNNCEFNYC